MNGDPVLSVVLALHRDQAYLDGCVRSVLDHPGRDIELVLVDNASPDHVPALVHDLSESDDRVVATRLAEAVPLGTARAAGIHAATGDYVWFLDTTDALVPDVVQQVTARLADGDVDVLLVDATTGRLTAAVPSPHARVLRSVSREGSADVAARPELLDVAASPWCLVVRRALLDQWSISPAGAHSDVPYAYSALLAASRVGALPAVGYLRRRPPNAAHVRSIHGDDATFAAELATVFTFAAEHSELAPRRAHLAASIVALLSQRYRRVSRRGRRGFAAQAADVVRRHADAGDVAPASRLGSLRFRLLRTGHPALFRSVEAARSTATTVRTVPRRAARRLAAAAARAAAGLRLVEYRLWRLLPIDRDLAVFAAYWYRAYSCNPRAVYEKLRELAPGVRGVWVVAADVTVPPGVDSVVVGTRAYYRLLARAGYFVNNVGFPDHWRKRRGSVLVHTHHGTPLKKMGLDQNEPTPTGQRVATPRQIARWSRWDYSLSSNRLSTLVWERVYPARYTTLEYGYPRNDRLATATDEDRDRIRSVLGVPPGRRVLLYAPTHREYEQGHRQILDTEALAATLGDDWVVLNRAHYFYATDKPHAGRGRVIDVSSAESVEDLCIAGDVLVTDYSSIMFDYAVLDRPVVIFAPDWEIYRLLRGTYFDLMSEPPGVVCRTQEELGNALTSGAWASDVATKARSLFRTRYCAWDDGRAAERVVRRVFLGEDPEPPRAAA